MKAVVLAAGEGSRLKPFTTTKPKVMLPVANKPILEYVVSALQESGIIDIVMVVGYKREKIMDYFQDGHAWGVDITYVEQYPQLGTAHALTQVSHLINDYFLVVNGDTIVGASNIKEIMRHRSYDATLLTTHADPAQKYGVVTTHNGLVKSIEEKPRFEEDGNIVNAGVYRFSRRIFDFLGNLEISERGEYEITDAIKRMILAGQAVKAIHSRAVWQDAMYPWDLLELNAAVMKRQKQELKGVIEHGAFVTGPVMLGEGSIIRPGSYVTGPACIGNNCDIGPNSVILPNTSIGNNCTLGPFTMLSNSIVMNDVRISTFSHISGSIIGEGTYIGPGFIAESGEARIETEGSMSEIHIGAIIGDNTEISGRVLAKPGNMIGTHCTIGPGAVVCANIRDHTRVL
jgi:glucose-1-phosphate thymidylyltransferase